MLEADLRLLAEGIAAVFIAIGGFKAQSIRRNGNTGKKNLNVSRHNLMSIEARDEIKDIREQFVPRTECNREHTTIAQRLTSIEGGIHELLGRTS